MNIPEIYKSPAKKFRTYWDIYGGWAALIRSPYLHAAILFTILAYPIWLDSKKDWTDLVMSVTPSILGFSLGGYAILFAFGDEKFRLAISGPDEDGSPSPFMNVNASFVHFLVMNVLALLLAILARAWIKDGSCLMGLVFCVFSYSVFAALATVMSIFSVASWSDAYAGKAKKNGTAKAPTP